MKYEKKTGIYVIENEVKKVVYVGGSKNLLVRLANHRMNLSKGNYAKGKMGDLQRSYNLHKSGFAFKIAVECFEADLYERERLLTTEYLDKGYEVYGAYLPKDSGMDVPDKYRPTVAKLIKLMESGVLSIEKMGIVFEQAGNSSSWD